MPAAANPNARVLTGTHFMLGDHACAEGALAAGLDFFGGYPITPSTEIAEHLARRLPEAGERVEHPSRAEDAAIAGRQRRGQDDEVDDSILQA